MDYVKLEEHLSIVLPEELDLTYQILPEYSAEQAVVCGWNADGLCYLLTADEQPGGVDHALHWQGLESFLKSSSSDNKIKVLKSGDYRSNEGLEISYRIYKRMQMGAEELLIFHLILNAAIGYWVMPGLAQASDVFIVHNQITKILKSARLTKS